MNRNRLGHGPFRHERAERGGRRCQNSAMRTHPPSALRSESNVNKPPSQALSVESGQERLRMRLDTTSRAEIRPQP